MNDTMAMIARCARHQMINPFAHTIDFPRANEAPDSPLVAEKTDQGIEGHAEPIVDTMIVDCVVTGLVGP